MIERHFFTGGPIDAPQLFFLRFDGAAFLALAVPIGERSGWLLLEWRP